MAEERPQEGQAEEQDKPEVDKSKVQAWLQEKWTGLKTCPVSGDNNWIIADDLLQPMIHASGGLRVGGRGYPLVMLICRTCGYTMFLNAVLMGLLDSSSGDD